MKTNLHMLCSLLALLALTFVLQTAQAQQSKIEYGFSYGPSNFLGDLGGNAGKGRTFLKDNMISLTRFMTGFNVAYRPFEFLNLN